MESFGSWRTSLGFAAADDLLGLWSTGSPCRASVFQQVLLLAVLLILLDKLLLDLESYESS